MIEVNYIDTKEERTIRLQITGHANTAPKGMDLLCAAVSTLLLTAVEMVECMDLAKCFEVPPVIKMEEGDAEVFVISKEKNAVCTNNSLYTILAGLLRLQRMYPENLRVDYHFI